MNFGHSVHQDFFFVPWNFPLLILRQSWNIANVSKRSSFSIYNPFPKVTCYRTVQNNEVVRHATCHCFIFWVWYSDHRSYSPFPFCNIFIIFIWTSLAQDIAILPRCLVYGWFLEEAGTLTLRDLISQNIENLRLILEKMYTRVLSLVPETFSSWAFVNLDI